MKKFNKTIRTLLNEDEMSLIDGVNELIRKYDEGEENWTFSDLVEEIGWLATEAGNYALEDAANRYKTKNHYDMNQYGGRGGGKTDKIEKEFLIDLKRILSEEE
jgi:hypothetical protein